MGVMGQIYGSRIVVGLASPSQNQLGAIGKMLVGFNQRVYGSFAKNRINASKKTRDVAQKELDASREQLKTFQGQTSGIIMEGVQTSLKQLRAMAGSEGPALEAKGAITRLGKQMGEAGFKLAPKLMQGVEPWMKNAEKMERMLQNLGAMDKNQQAQIVKYAKNRYEGQKREVDKLKEKHKLGEITEATLNKEIRLMNEYKNEYDEFNQVVGDNRLILEENAKAERELEDDVKDKAKTRDKAEKDYQEALKTTEQGLENVAVKTKEIIVAIKQGFTEAVQQSTIALTAFYYKLNQNTQELIAFERELLNANSVFNITRAELFDTGEAITQFGQQFGLEMQNGATGLYQLASAGLSAADALTVLPETLKLSMAVQGDHNTISKLTAQTIMGFGMEFSESSILVDKFAHSIQKSLIEYQDLSSAVKFALPFFTATGQSIDQLLGALEILTNRALEAGIAGRGLRQALSEFAEHADDNAAAFRKMGVEILNADGTMRQLTEIAADYADKIGPEAAHNTELLTSMIKDLNVRGATAFIHLVQSSDEFTQSVEDLKNAGGELDEMVKIQNESLQAQIQILKNNIAAIFLMRDAEYSSTEYMNAFHEAVVKLIQSFQELLVVETDSGYVLSEFGKQLQEIAISGVYLFVDLAKQVVQILKEFTTEGKLNLDILKLYTIPLKIILNTFNALGPNMQRAVVYMHMMSKLIPLQAIAMMLYAGAYVLTNAHLIRQNWLTAWKLILGEKEIEQSEERFVFTQVEIAQTTWLIYLRETEAKQIVKDIGYKMYQLTLEPLLKWWRGVEIKERLTLLWAKIKDNFLTYASITLKLAWVVVMAAGYVALLVVLPLWALWNLALLIWNKEMSWAIVQTALFWIVASAGIIILVVLLAGLVIAFYDMAKELGIVGAVVKIVQDKFTAWGAKMREVWEERIYPFIYRVGMEFRALFGVLGIMIQGFWEKLGENTVFQGFVYWIKVIAGLIMGTLMAPIRILIAAFQILWESVKFVIEIFKALGAGGIGDIVSALGKAVGNFGSAILGIIGGTIEKIIDDIINPFAAGGYIKAMASGGTAPHGINLVGERGPEFFMPSQSGQIINSRRTQEILYDIKRRAGADSTGRGMANTIIVNEIRAQKSVNRKTRMSVDTFAGVV